MNLYPTKIRKCINFAEQIKLNANVMQTLKLDISKIYDTINSVEVLSYQNQIENSYRTTLDKTGKGSDFLGWVDLPSNVDPGLIANIEASAAKMKSKAEIFVVIGIGGSYLGARAVIEALNNNFSLLNPSPNQPLIVYAGHNIGEDYLNDLIHVLDQKDYALTVISKSGTTTEPALAFRILKNHLEKKYGKKEAGERIIAVTDKEKGALKKLATDEGYKTYIVPDDIGGRYSVMTPVGLLPIAVAGFDINKLIEGAREMEKLNKRTAKFGDNPMALYAAARNALYKAGKKVEIMVNYQPNLYYLTEWWKQLYGESEGKEGKGIFPAGVNFTTDLHSLGQYIQDGQRMLFETVLSVENPKKELKIPPDKENLDGLNFLAGKRIHEVNKMAELGTMLAHVDGGVPNIKISIPQVSEYHLGQLIYFFEMACALSGYTLGVNPFDQPGVEAYKKNMFALLGKPGFEAESDKIRRRIE